MKKLFLIILIAILAGPFAAQAQSLNLKIGVFSPTMNSDLWEINLENLEFEKADMLDLFYSIEYEWMLSRNFSLSFEGGVYKKEKRSYYRDFEFDDGSLINQNLSLRITSIEGIVKFYPLGRRRTFYPYLAGGVGAYAWKYEQYGYFIDSYDGSVSEGYSESSKLSPGFTARAGCVFRIGRNTGLSLEARYLFLKDYLDESMFQGFEKFDLNGYSFNLGFHFFLW